MSRREQRTIELALSILWRCAKHVGAPDRNDGMRLALRTLLPYVEARQLSLFWTVAGNVNSAQRVLVLRKMFKQIERIVERVTGLALGSESRL